MKRSLLALIFTGLFFVPRISAQNPRQTPIGIREANKAEAQAEAQIPPPVNRRPTVDVSKLTHDAEELAGLAQSIPPKVDQAVKGALPADLSAKLKRIEKLSKRLRSELNP